MTTINSLLEDSMTMTEGLFGLCGVLLGGVIGVVSTYLQLQGAHKRWKIEAQVTYLKNKRDQCREAYARYIDLTESAKWKSSPRASAEVFRVLVLSTPPGFEEELTKLKNAENADEAHMLCMTLMQRHLHALDSEIQALLSAC